MVASAVSGAAAQTDDPLAAWDSIPLFMKTLPAEFGGQSDTKGKGKAGDTRTEDNNVALEALQSLMYDGTPSEIAADLRIRANELFQARKFRDALGFYTRALDEVGKDLPVEERRTLWSNRAAANLELGNYGAVLRDVSSVLSTAHDAYPEKPSPSSHRTTMKALLRSARALSGLDKLPEAIDALDRLVLLEKELGEADKDVGKSVRVEVQKKEQRQAAREAESSERRRRETETERSLREAFKARGVLLPRSAAKKLFATCPTDIAPPHFDPDALPPASLPSVPLLSADKWTRPPATTPIIFPTFLLLPLADPPTRDLCLAMHTSATFGDMLASMEHDSSAVQLYVATRRGRVLKVGAKLTLEKVLAAASSEGDGGLDDDGCELVDGWALEVIGVPKSARGDSWVQNWKSEVKAGSTALL